MTGFKYITTINQKAIIDFNQLHNTSLDLVDGVIIDFINGFIGTKISRKYRREIENEDWYLMKYQFLIDQLPLIPVNKPQSMSKRIHKLVKAGILKIRIEKTEGNNVYIATTDNFDSLFYNIKESVEITPPLSTQELTPYRLKSRYPIDSKVDTLSTQKLIHNNSNNNNSNNIKENKKIENDSFNSFFNNFKEKVCNEKYKRKMSWSDATKIKDKLFEFYDQRNDKDEFERVVLRGVEAYYHDINVQSPQKYIKSTINWINNEEWDNTTLLQQYNTYTYEQSTKDIKPVNMFLDHYCSIGGDLKRTLAGVIFDANKLKVSMKHYNQLNDSNRWVVYINSDKKLVYEILENHKLDQVVVEAIKNTVENSSNVIINTIKLFNKTLDF